MTITIKTYLCRIYTHSGLLVAVKTMKTTGLLQRPSKI